MKGWGRTIAVWLYHRLVRRRLLHIDETRSLLSGIRGGNLRQTEEMTTEYYIQLIQKIGIVIMIGSILLGAIGISRLISDGEMLHIVRSDYGGDSERMTIYYEDTEHNRQPIELEIEPVKYREEELEEIFRQGFTYLEERMLGDNASTSSVTGDLQLETDIPGSGLSVNWISDDYEYLSDDGRIHNEEISSQIVVNLTAELTYEDEIRKREYSIYIMPEQAESVSAEQVKAAGLLEQELQKHRYDQEIDLPAVQEEYHYFMTNQEKQDYLYVIAGTVVIIIYLIVHHKSQLKEQIQDRRHQMELEYSYFMNQILLYISAGNTAQGAILRIITQYEKHHRKDHPLYQELVRVKNEMHTGVSQEQAFLHFGRRTGVLAYMKAMALLTQQIKKGGQGMSEQLEQEEHEAFEYRKELAKKSGEEAGTKLLLPMILLMIVSMILVMYPAFASLSIGL